MFLLHFIFSCISITLNPKLPPREEFLLNSFSSSFNDDDLRPTRERGASERTKETREKSASARVPRVVGGFLVKVAKRERKTRKTPPKGADAYVLEPKTMKKRTQQLERMSSQAERGTMKKILFYCPDMEKMAREVQANDPGALELFRALFVRARFGFSLPRSVVPFCVTNQRSLLFELFSFARARAVVYSCVQMRSNWARSNGVDFQMDTRTYLSRTRTIFEGDTWLS